MGQQKKRIFKLIKSPSQNLRRRPKRKRSQGRKFALVLLFVLGVLIGTFFYLSKPQNVRASAERYLERLLNGEVEVEQASFSLTQGVKLTGIRILQKGAQAPSNLVFKADNVNLKLSWLALVQGRFEAREISAFRPEVFLVEGSSGTWNFEPLFIDRDFKHILPLPKIVLREGQVHYYEDVGGKAVLGGTFRLMASFESEGSGTNYYFGQVETSVGEQTVARLEGRFNTASGTFSEIAAKISLSEVVRQSLPRRARVWMDKYNIRGQLSVSGHYGPETQTRIKVELEGLDCRLPLNEQKSITINNARGQLHFTDEGILLGAQELGESGGKEPLRFAALGAQWAIGGQFLGYEQQSDFALDISSPEFLLPRDPELIKSLPRALRTILEDWDASGLIAIDSNLKRVAKVGPQIQASGQVRCIDAAGEFRYFPYPIKNIQGLIRFNPQKTFLEDFRASHQSNKDPNKVVHFVGNGEVLAPYEKPKAVFNMTITGLILDDELRAALLDKDKAKWDRFKPSGSADVQCRVVHEPGDEELWKAYIEADLTGASATDKEFPYPLQELRGRVYIGPNEVEIGRGVGEGLEITDKEPKQEDFVSGRAGKGKVQLRGLVDNLGGPDELMNLEVKADGLEFDEVLAKALPSEAKKLYEVVNPSGSGDVWGKIIRAKSEEPDFLIDVWPRDAKCRHKDFPYPLEQVKGPVRLSPGKFELLDFSAKQGSATFTGSGVVASKDNEHYEAALTIIGQGVQLDKLVYENLDPQQKQLWDQLQPGGKCDVKLEIVNDPQGQLTHQLKVEPRGAQITYKPFPYELGNLSGELIIEPEQVRVDVRGSDPAIQIAGHLREHKNEQLVKLAVFADDVALDEKLRIALPEKMQRLWEVFEPRGKVDVKIDSLDHIQGASGEGLLGLEGSLVLKELSLNKPLLCQNLSGTVRGLVQSGPDGPQVVLLGELALPELKVGQLRVKKLSGTLAKESKDSDQWSIHHIQGEMGGGQVAGNIEGNKGADGKYEALLQVVNVDLAKLIKEFQSAKPEGSKNKENGFRAEGRLTGSVGLEGNFNEPGSMGGRGHIFIDRARLYDLPLIIRMLHTLSLQANETNAFETAAIDFYLQGQDIIFTEIILDGPALRMGGMGVYDRKKDWLTVVVTRDPPKNILSGLPAFPEAMVAEINGPLGDAQVEAKPFREVSEELKKLFRKRKTKQ